MGSEGSLFEKKKNFFFFGFERERERVKREKKSFFFSGSKTLNSSHFLKLNLSTKNNINILYISESVVRELDEGGRRRGVKEGKRKREKGSRKKQTVMTNEAASLSFDFSS